MRKITSTDLSEEQEDILLYAPLKGVILILGPPGSGKTVMAFLRGEALVKKFDSVTLIMFNKVLQTFSKNGTKNPEIKVKTMHSWAWHWWYGITRQKNVPQFEDYEHDWMEIYKQLADRHINQNLNLDNVDWKHLIVDEGQDFRKEMYHFLNLLRNTFFHNREIPSLTILADENQRINENNSTIPEIIEQLKIEDKYVFNLTKNYRNTDQINSLISYFYVGTETGMTKPSGTQGELPKLVVVNDYDSTIEYIIRYIKAHQNEEIAIIVSNHIIRKRYYNSLYDSLDPQYFHVQTYANRSKVYTAEKLEFDLPGTVTVINKQSCKGLEFDAVFIPELQKVDVAEDNITGFKMEMYVMCSRARRYLTLMAQSADYDDLPIYRHLPTSANVLEYINV